mgnify:CR=1 FL=1
MKLTRRATLGAGIAALATPYLGRRAMAAGGTVNVYNWADYIGETTLADFEAATGITPVYDVYDSAEAAEAKLMAGQSGYDVVVTADIPLASRCLKKVARVLGPAGKPFTEDNIGNALATRELMSDLRAYGVGGGPPPFGPRDRSRFLEALELAVREARRQRAGGVTSPVPPTAMAP